MVTVKEVAKLAQVSPATVSRVLNGAENVSQDIRARVKTAVQELGYFPNSAARTLVNRRTGVLAVMLHDLHSPFYSDLICGFEQAAMELKRNVVFCSLGDNQDCRDRYIQLLTNGLSDAVILYGTVFSDQPIIEHLLSVKFPFLLIENNFENLPANQILINNLEGSRTAMEYLVSKGHKRIAYFMGDSNKKVHLERFNGYTQVMQKYGLVIANGDIKNIYTDYDMAFEMAASMMRQPKDIRPTAVFTSNDRIAVRIIQGIMSQGYRVPQDISVMGFDNQSIYGDGYRGPSITSVRQPLFKIGRDSLHILTQILEGEIASPYTKTYETELVEMGTVCAPPDTL